MKPHPFEAVVLALSTATTGATLYACAAADKAKPAAYGVELAACTETSATLAESVDCENRTRARYGRPPRVVLVVDRDGGAP